MVITVSYSVHHDDADAHNSTNNASGLQNLLLLSWPLPQEKYTEWQGPLPSPEEVDEALQAGQQALLLREAYEDKLPEMQRDSPSFRHQLSTKTSPTARELAKTGYVSDEAAKALYVR